MVMTTKSKSPPNNEDDTPPVGGDSGGAGEFDLAADAAPVSPSTADERGQLAEQVKEDCQGEEADVPVALVKVIVPTPRNQWHCFAHPTFEGRFKILRHEPTGHIYLIAGAALQDDRIQDFLQVKDLYPLCTTQGGIFIWAAPAP